MTGPRRRARRRQRRREPPTRRRPGGQNPTGRHYADPSHRTAERPYTEVIGNVTYLRPISGWPVVDALDSDDPERHLQAVPASVIEVVARRWLAGMSTMAGYADTSEWPLADIAAGISNLSAALNQLYLYGALDDRHVASVSDPDWIRDPNLELSAEATERLDRYEAAMDDQRLDLDTMVRLGLDLYAFIDAHPRAERMEMLARVHEAGMRRLMLNPDYRVDGFRARNERPAGRRLRRPAPPPRRPGRRPARREQRP